ncbi:hypothetical protein ABBQ32_000838 [Trebouxia sp. C0010 RCD-2024]
MEGVPVTELDHRQGVQDMAADRADLQSIDATVEHKHTGVDAGLDSVLKHAGYPVYIEPSLAQQQLVQQTWAEICYCTVTSTHPCSCDCPKRFGDDLPGSRCGIQYVHLRNIQVGKWLYGVSMQEFVHLLNLRQRSVEAARHTT